MRTRRCSLERIVDLDIVCQGCFSDITIRLFNDISESSIFTASSSCSTHGTGSSFCRTLLALGLVGDTLIMLTHRYGCGFLHGIDFPLLFRSTFLVFFGIRQSALLTNLLMQTMRPISCAFGRHLKIDFDFLGFVHSSIIYRFGYLVMLRSIQFNFLCTSRRSCSRLASPSSPAASALM